MKKIVRISNASERNKFFIFKFVNISWCIFWIENFNFIWNVKNFFLKPFISIPIEFLKPKFSGLVIVTLFKQWSLRGISRGKFPREIPRGVPAGLPAGSSSRGTSRGKLPREVTAGNPAASYRGTSRRTSSRGTCRGNCSHELEINL